MPKPRRGSPPPPPKHPQVATPLPPLMPCLEPCPTCQEGLVLTQRWRLDQSVVVLDDGSEKTQKRGYWEPLGQPRLPVTGRVYRCEGHGTHVPLDLPSPI